jgi:hypothetical protein
MNPIPNNSELSVEEKHLADFCQSTGVRYLTAGGLFWDSRGLRLFSPWPFYRPISLSPRDLRHMWSHGAFFLHFVSADDGPFFPGYDLVVGNKNYDLDCVKSSKRRHNIRWALKRCTVERVSFKSLIKLGPQLIEDTHNRQDRSFNESVLKMWMNYFRSAESNPLFEAWASFVSKQLAALNVLVTVGGGAYIEMTFSRSDLLKYHPVDALSFFTTREAIRRECVTQVSYGRRPITGEAEGLINFKESMGFTKVPVKERVEVNPILKPLLCGRLTPLVDNISGRYCDRSMYARIISAVTCTLRGQIGHCQ